MDTTAAKIQKLFDSIPPSEAELEDLCQRRVAKIIEKQKAEAEAEERKSKNILLGVLWRFLFIVVFVFLGCGLKSVILSHWIILLMIALIGSVVWYLVSKKN